MTRNLERVLRLVPLALLAAITTGVVMRRVRSTGRRGEPYSAVSATPPVAVVAPETRRGLGAPLPSMSALVPPAVRMLHGDRRRTHRAHGHLPREPNLAWTAALGAPIVTQVVPSPDERLLVAASLGGSLVGLLRTGQPRWTVPLGDRIYATAAVGDDGVFYVGSDAKKFVAVGPDGGVRWKLDVGAEADTAAAFAPDGTLVFAAGATVFAVRKGGDVAWRFRGRGKVFTAPAVMDDGTVVVGSQDHHVVAIRAGGALGWAVDLGHDVDGGPAVGDDGSIFVGTDGGEVVRLDKDGRVGWRVKVGGFVRGALSLARNGDVLVGVYGPSPRVLRLVGDDGSERGSYAVRGTGAREFGVHGGPLEDDDGALAFGTQDDQVTVVEADGSLRWSFRTGGDVDAPLTLLTDGTLLVGSEDGKVYAFR